MKGRRRHTTAFVLSGARDSLDSRPVTLPRAA